MLLTETIRSARGILILGVLLLATNNYSQDRQSILSSGYPKSRLKKMLVSREAWQPFPTWDERESWLSLSDEIRKTLIGNGEALLGSAWPPLPATLFLEFARSGNRENFQKPQRERRDALTRLVIAECVEGNGRFLDDIVNGIWAICEESYWGVPAHLSMQAQGIGLPDVAEPTVDLFANETGSLLAWTNYLLKSPLDKVTPLITQRIELEVEKRILEPCLRRDDFWWMGFRPGVTVNNWNPWNNSNWLTTVLLMEKDKERRLAAVEKIMQSLDIFISSYPADGGCDEGPNYWNRAAGSLFDCLELLFSATKGAVNVYSESLIQEMGRYIYRAHISDRYFVNFGDASATATVESDLAYRYGRRIDDERLASFGVYMDLFQRQRGRTFEGSLGRQLFAIFNYAELSAAKPNLPFLRDVWLPGNQVMTARSEAGSASGFFVAAKGGHNAENHNHNDVGNFIVYFDGQPMIVDVGVETYTRKTFGPQRYEIWTMQSAYHNLPTINGIMQRDGRNFAAKNVSYSSDDAFAQLRLDIADAYPQEAGVDQWMRTIRLNRGQDVEIIDEFDLKHEAQNVELTMMTPCKVTFESPGKITLEQIIPNSILARVSVSFDAEKLTPSLENIELEDAMLKSNWGNRMIRILLRSNFPTSGDTWTLRITP